MPTTSHINDNELKSAANVLRAINHKLRRSMMAIIEEQSDICVSDIQKRLNLEQSVASQHLAVLRKAGFVNTKREGKQVLYSMNWTHLTKVLHIAPTLIPQKG